MKKCSQCGEYSHLGDCLCRKCGARFENIVDVSHGLKYASIDVKEIFAKADAHVPNSDDAKVIEKYLATGDENLKPRPKTVVVNEGQDVEVRRWRNDGSLEIRQEVEGRTTETKYLPPLYNEAYKSFAHAASMGSAAAFRKLARLTVDGNGVEKNLQDAYALYCKAALLGDEVAEKDLEIGWGGLIGGEKEWSDAVNLPLYEEASADGFRWAMFGLAMMYFHGKCVKRDYEKSLCWSRKAWGKPTSGVLGHGLDAAKAHGVWLYFDGIGGVEMDILRALRFYDAISSAEIRKRLAYELLQRTMTYSDTRKSQDWVQTVGLMSYVDLRRLKGLIDGAFGKFKAESKEAWQVFVRFEDPINPTGWYEEDMTKRFKESFCIPEGKNSFCQSMLWPSIRLTKNKTNYCGIMFSDGGVDVRGMDLPKTERPTYLTWDQFLVGNIRRLEKNDAQYLIINRCEFKMSEANDPVTGEVESLLHLIQTSVLSDRVPNVTLSDGSVSASKVGAIEDAKKILSKIRTSGDWNRREYFDGLELLAGSWIGSSTHDVSRDEYIESQYYLGCIYLDGKIVERNVEEAQKHLEESSLPMAQIALAKLYLGGEIQGKGRRDGLEILKKESESGNNAAALIYGEYKSEYEGLLNSEAKKQRKTYCWFLVKSVLWFLALRVHYAISCLKNANDSSCRHSEMPEKLRNLFGSVSWFLFRAGVIVGGLFGWLGYFSEHGIPAKNYWGVAGTFIVSSYCVRSYLSNEWIKYICALCASTAAVACILYGYVSGMDLVAGLLSFALAATMSTCFMREWIWGMVGGTLLFPTFGIAIGLVCAPCGYWRIANPYVVAGIYLLLIGWFVLKVKRIWLCVDWVYSRSVLSLFNGVVFLLLGACIWIFPMCWRTESLSDGFRKPEEIVSDVDRCLRQTLTGFLGEKWLKRD